MSPEVYVIEARKSALMALLLVLFIVAFVLVAARLGGIL